MTEVRLLPDDDEREFAATLRRAFAVDQDAATQWRSLVSAGVLGLVLPELYGGSGGRLTDLATFCVEAGRGLCPTLVHGTIHAGIAIHALGTPEQRAALLPTLADGRFSATTALWSPVDASLVAPTVRAERIGGAWALAGCVDFVLDADRADLIAVSATDAATGRNLVVMVPNSELLRTDPVTLMGGRTAARVHFDGVTAAASHVLGIDGGISEEQLRRLANTATTLLSFDLVGVGEAALQRTVDYTVMRQQFGRPIASFQAAQHLVANMHIALAAARLAARAAVALLEDGHVATRQTAVARMHAATAAKLITLDAHQLHGGMGYVVDTDLHRYSERARVLSTLGGGADIAATWLEEGYP